MNEEQTKDEAQASGLASLPNLKVTKQSFADRIYADLRVALMSGAYKPGDRLNIRKIAAEYLVSETPVREAVVQLMADGALELRLGHQPRLPILSIPDYLEIRETRVPLERLATELAVANLTSEDIEDIKRYHVAYIDADNSEDWKSAMMANQEFHFSIYRKSGNKVLIRLIENLWLLTGPFINNQYPYKRKPIYDVHPHELILDALVRRSPAEAGDLVVHDIRDGSNLILEKLRASSPSTRKSLPKA